MCAAADLQLAAPAMGNSNASSWLRFTWLGLTPSHKLPAVHCSYRADGQEEHVQWPEMSHLLVKAEKWTGGKKRKGGTEGAKAAPA